MLLNSYQDLIRQLPYLDQAFETKRTTWRRQCQSSKIFRDYCENVFNGDMLKLSRRDLFEASEKGFHEGLFSIIFWGYPRNMRGNTFSNILESLQRIEIALPKNKELSTEQFLQIIKATGRSGLGLSTLTKILYFFRFRIEGCACLIMDSRIIDVLNHGHFIDLSISIKITEFKKLKAYVPYLHKIHEISTGNTYSPDQLEMFLFLFGGNLKSRL